MAFHKPFSGPPLSTESDDSLSVSSAPLAPNPHAKSSVARAYVCQYAGCNRTYINEHSRRQHYRRSHRTRQQTEPNGHVPVVPTPKGLAAGKHRAHSEPNIEGLEERLWGPPHTHTHTQPYTHSQSHTPTPTQPHTHTLSYGIQLHSDKRRPFQFQRSLSSPNVGPSPATHPYVSHRRQHTHGRYHHQRDTPYGEDPLHTSRNIMSHQHSDMHFGRHTHTSMLLKHDDQLPEDLKDLPDTLFDFHPPRGPQSTFSLDSLVGQGESVWDRKHNRYGHVGFERMGSRGDGEQRYTPVEETGWHREYGKRGGGSEGIRPDPDRLSGHQVGHRAENEGETWMELEAFRNELDIILGVGKGMDASKKTR